MTENITTNLSASPYNDDFNEDKKFVKILFKPSLAVQTRELNQIQTILQNQISRFASHIFKEGSVVEGVSITYNNKQTYVHLKNSFNGNSSFSILDLPLNSLIVNAQDVRAVPRVIKAGFEQSYPNTNRIYLDYVKTGKDLANSDVYTFSSNDILTVYNQNQSALSSLDANNVFDTINVISANSTVNAIGVGYSVKISDGIIYQKGFFSKVNPQTTIVKDFDTNTANYAVGFETQESIINSDIDDSLFDNSNGTTNTFAPGADRFKLDPILIAVDRTTLSSNSTFFPISEFNDTLPVEKNIDPVYAKLGDSIKQRTSEESGNYIVKPFMLETQIHANNTALMNYQVSPGIGYVNGSRIELIGSKTVTVPRATTTEEAQAQIITSGYGNYVKVRELVGNFNSSTLPVITIYDSPQTTISDLEGSGSGNSGNIVGNAVLRSYIHLNGLKGVNNTEYRFYLTDIKMNSGKNFATDAKSFYYNGPLGAAKADIVLENSKAILKESNKDILIFPFGVQSIKRLTDKAGVNDTQFVFRDSASATLQANGSATFTIDSPYAGGTEKLNYSIGTISDTAELDFDFTLNSLAYTANQAGTVSVSGVTLTGTGTSFTTLFKVGDNIRFPVSGDIRKIVAIANTTSASLNSTSTASSVPYQKFWAAGSVIDLSTPGASINILSNTQFSIVTGMGALDSGSQTSYATYSVLRNSANPAKKNIIRDVFVKIDCSTAGVLGPFNLGLVDVNKIKGVFFGTTYSESNPNRMDWFDLDNGQKDNVYDHAKLVLKPAFKNKLAPTSRLLIKLDIFQANVTGGIGFFSVDSYPIINEGNTANSSNISIGEISRYNNLDVRSFVDFRPQHFNTATVANTEASATVNPVTANSSYNIVSTGSYLIKPDTNFQADIEYYLPRIDIVSMTKDGEINVTFGEPSLESRTPKSENDVMDIAKIVIPAYPSLTTRESEQYNRYDLGSKINLISIRRYTMKDIGVLDERIKRLEYYVTLNALEQSAKDLTITDANGLDRFKNGIFADSFKSHALGNVSDAEYKISIDADNNIARPYFEKDAVEYYYDGNNSINIYQSGPKITLPFESVNYISQSYATKFRNCTESVWRWNGDMTLYPEYDHFRDEKRDAAVNVSLDLASNWEDFANSPFSSNFGDWRTTAVDTTSSTAVNAGATQGSSVTKTTTTTSSTQDRLVSDLSVNVSTSNYSFGSSLTDISVNPYMRSKEVAFIVSGLKPNSNFYAFFDDVPVSYACAPAVLSNNAAALSSAESTIVNRSASWGTQLKSDSIGVVIGIFLIPEGQFRVGDRTLVLSNVDSLIQGQDAALSKASAVYTASSTSVTTQEKTLSTRDATLSVSSYTDSRTLTDTTVNTDTISAPITNITNNITEIINNETTTVVNNVVNNNTTINNTVINNKIVNDITKITNVTNIKNVITPAVVTPVNNFDGSGRDGDRSDPISQSFLVTAPSGVTSAFIDKIGVYFKAKDINLGCTVYLMEMANGYPNVSMIIAKKHLEASQINVSANASIETIFDFDDVVCVTKDQLYAFMVKPDGDSPEYLIWCSEVGGKDIVSGTQVFSNPYVGTTFISANSNTWTALQLEDLKFNVYRANFTHLYGNLAFNNENDDYFTINDILKANSSLSVQVGDIVRTANSTGGVLTSNTSPVGWVQSLDESTNSLIIDTSSGNFVANTNIQIHREFMNNQSVLNANTLIASTKIISIDDRQYSMIVPRFASITPAMTNVTYQHRGTDVNYQIDPEGFIKVTPEIENERTDKNRIVSSYSNEKSNLGNEKSSVFNISLTTYNSYVSPVVDMLRKSSLIIRNIINNDSTNEHTRYGNALTKYLSKNIVLEDGQDAEDLELYLTAYKPAGTNILVYTRLLNSEDTNIIEDKVWTKMDVTGTQFSSSTDVKDMKEFKFNLPKSAPVVNAAFVNSGTGVVGYTRADGQTYNGYKQFAIKIVLLAENNAKIPLLKDVRAICLQV